MFCYLQQIKESFIDKRPYDNKLSYRSNKQGRFLSPQHLYILSDDEIKKGDWFYCFTKKIVYQKIGNVTTSDCE